MPRVPTYEPGQVAPRALPGVEVVAPRPVQSRNSAQNQIMDLAGIGFDYGVRALEQQRDTDVFNAGVALQTGTQDFYRSAQESRLGNNARGVLDDGIADFDRRRDEIAAGLTDRRARDAFLSSSARQRLSLSSQLGSFQQQQGDLAYESAFRAGRAAAIDAGMFADTQEAIDDARQSLIAANVNYAMRKGLDEAWVQQAVVDDTSKVHAAQIGRFVDTDRADAAQAYMDRYRSEIRGQDILPLERLLAGASLLKKGQSIAETLDAEGVNEADGLKRIRAEYEGEEQKAALQQWKQLHDDNRLAVKDAQARVDDEIKRYQAAGRTPPPNLLALASGGALLDMKRERENDAWRQESRGYARARHLEDAALDTADNALRDFVFNNPGVKPPITMMLAARPATQSKMLDVYNDEISGKDAVTDPKVYGDLLKEQARDPVAFSNKPLTPYFDKLGKTERKELLRLQAKGASPEGATEVKVNNALAKTYVLAPLGIGEGKGDSKKYGAVMQYVDEALRAKAAGGRKLTQQDQIDAMKEAAVLYAVKGRVESTGFDSSASYLGAIGTGRGDKFYLPLDKTANVPDAALRRIRLGDEDDRDAVRDTAIRQLRAAGVDSPSDAQIDRRIDRVLYDQLKGRK